MNLQEYIINKEIEVNKKEKELSEGAFSFLSRTPKRLRLIQSSVLPFANSIFSSYLYDRITDVFDNIRFKEISKNKSIIGYSMKNTIYLNKNVFYSLSNTKQMEYILHEIMHVLQNKDESFKNDGARIYKFYTDNKIDEKTSESEIAIGKKNLSKKFFNENETLPYLLNENIDFSLLKEGSKEKFIKLLRVLNLFDLNSMYWKNKLK